MTSHAGLARKASVFATQARQGNNASDFALNSNELYVVVTTAGDLDVVPYGNDDSNNILFVSAPVGFVPPFRVKTVKGSTTTAEYATVRP